MLNVPLDPLKSISFGHSFVAADFSGRKLPSPERATRQIPKATTMTNIEKLLSISSQALDSKPGAFPVVLREYALGSELFQMLEQKNGSYAFEYALHVFPLSTDPEVGLEGWNAESLWRKKYEDLAEGLLFFAEDILQDQFCLSKAQSGVHRFHAETGQTTFMAESVEEWAGVILSNYRTETGWPFVHEWQEKNGRLPLGEETDAKDALFPRG